jgi:hypothetical protein
MEEMRSAFREVCSYEADEDGLQLLLRLPGLVSEPNETRRFVDHDLADSAYGEDLGQYLFNPHSGGHPLCGPATWTTATGGLAAAVAAEYITERNIDNGIMMGALHARIKQGFHDAVLLDCIRTADKLDLRPDRSISVPIREVLIGSLTISENSEFLCRCTFTDCVMEELNVSSISASSSIPVFSNCLIGRVVGWREIPAAHSSRFTNTPVTQFDDMSVTSSAILRAGIDLDSRIGLTVLEKIYEQAGRGRAESALSRGLPPDQRGRVPSVLAQLISGGLVQRQTRGNSVVYTAVRERRSDVRKWLSAPNSFNLNSVKTT